MSVSQAKSLTWTGAGWNYHHSFRAVSYTHLDVYKRQLGLKADAKTEDVAASIMALKAGAPDTQAELLALKQRMACLLYTSRCV